MGKEGEKGQLTRTSKRKRGSSMTSKQNRGGPASPSHPPWLHRNTRAVPTLQTHSFPLSSATLHYPVLSQAQRGTAPLSPHIQPCARSQPRSQAPRRPGHRVDAAPQASGHTHFICIVHRQHWEVCTGIILSNGSKPFFVRPQSC